MRIYINLDHHPSVPLTVMVSACIKLLTLLTSLKIPIAKLAENFKLVFQSQSVQIMTGAKHSFNHSCSHILTLGYPCQPLYATTTTSPELKEITVMARSKLGLLSIFLAPFHRRSGLIELEACQPPTVHSLAGGLVAFWTGEYPHNSPRLNCKPHCKYNRSSYDCISVVIVESAYPWRDVLAQWKGNNRVYWSSRQELSPRSPGIPWGLSKFILEWEVVENVCRNLRYVYVNLHLMGYANSERWREA